MKIVKSKEIIKYLDRLKENIDANYQNDFLDGYVDIKDEQLAKEELILAGQQEFIDNKDISLFIDAYNWNNNPYVKNVKFNNINSNKYSYVIKKIEKGYLFNADAIIDDRDKELKDYMKLRALNNDIDALFLYQNNKEWMMSVPSESLTNDPYALKAHGNVVTFGLGIGYFTYMALLNKNVNSVTIIEKSNEVIELFNSIKQYFPSINKIKIINGDAYEYFNSEYLDKYDYIYVDIWQSSDDGRKIIEKLLERYNPPFNKCDFWIEKSCTNIIRHLIYAYYQELITNKKYPLNNSYKHLMDKIRRYFNSINIEVKDVDTLKNYMYDQKVIRKILSLKK